MKGLKLVIPVDFTPAAKDALQYAIDFSNDDEAELILVHVLNNLSQNDATSKFEELVKEKLADFSGTVRTEIIKGDVEDHIGHFADNEKASFVIMGVHEQTLLDSLLGSRAMDVIAYSKTPFITIQEGTTYRNIDKIAMTVDLDTDSIQVVKSAAKLAQNMNAELLLVAGNHSDPNFERKVKTNLKVAQNYLDDQHIKSSIELIDRDRFMDGLLEICQNEGVDIISATYYLKTLSIFSEKFVQRLISNQRRLPVLTVDAQIISSGPQYPFITT